MAGLNEQSYAGSMTACLGKQVRRLRYLKTGSWRYLIFWSSDHRLCCFIPATVLYSRLLSSALRRDVWHQHVHGGLADFLHYCVTTATFFGGLIAAAFSRCDIRNWFNFRRFFYCGSRCSCSRRMAALGAELQD